MRHRRTSTRALFAEGSDSVLEREAARGNAQARAKLKEQSRKWASACGKYGRRDFA
jgi:hypothetical protein